MLKIFTAIVPLIDTYRYNNTGSSARRKDRNTGLSSKKFKSKYILICIKGCIYNLKNIKIFNWLKKAKKNNDDDDDEDDLDQLNDKEISQLIKNYDEDLVRDVKSAISRKLNYLNQLFRFMRSNDYKIDDKILKRFHLQLTDISNYNEFDDYNLDRSKFKELDALFDNNLGDNSKGNIDEIGEESSGQGKKSIGKFNLFNNWLII